MTFPKVFGNLPAPPANAAAMQNTCADRDLTWGGGKWCRMSTEQAGVVPSRSVYTQHGRLVMSNVRQWRHGQKGCPGGIHKGYEHGPQDKTKTLQQNIHALLTILQWANPRSRAGGKAGWLTSARRNNARDAVQTLFGEVTPDHWCGKDTQ